MDRCEIYHFMQKHLVSIQSQRHCKGIAKSISNSVVYFSNYFYIRMNFFGIAFYQLRVMAVGTYILRQSAGFFKITLSLQNE